MSKTPFEIRTELLEMATKHATDQYMANLEFARKMFEKTLEGVKPYQFANIEEALKWQKSFMDQVQAFMPQMPSIEEITNKAQELYGFVQKKD